MTTPPYPPETSDLSCIRCGYLLRGLAAGGQCPECGHDILTSLAMTRRLESRLVAAARRLGGSVEPVRPLSDNSPAWLRRVALGPLALALWMPLMVGWQWWRRGIPWWERVPEYPLLVLMAWFAATVWIITWPDHPAEPVRDRRWARIRLWLRITSLAPVVSAALACVSEVVAARDHSFYAGAAIKLALLLPVVTLLLLDHLTHLARRLGSVWLAACFRPSMVVIAALAFLVAPNVRQFDAYGSPTARFPDVVGSLIDMALYGCCFVGAAWSLAVFVALLDMSTRIWRLAGENG